MQCAGLPHGHHRSETFSLVFLRFVVFHFLSSCLADFDFDMDLENHLQDYIAQQLPKLFQDAKQAETGRFEAVKADLAKKEAALKSLDDEIAKNQGGGSEDDVRCGEGAPHCSIEPEGPLVCQTCFCCASLQKLYQAQADLEHAKSQVDHLQSTIDDLLDKIHHLKWYQKWKAVGYGIELAGVELAKKAADAFLTVAIDAVKAAEKLLPDPKKLDPRIAAKEIEHGLAQAALELATHVVDASRSCLGRPYGCVLPLLVSLAL